MKGLIRFFFTQHLFGNMLYFLLLLVGLWSVFTIRKDLFPKVDFDTTLVIAALPGASPEQVERLLINPIEQAVREVDGLKKVISNATEGRAVVTIQLDPDARDPDKTNTDLQRAIDRIEDYPEEAERPVVKALESGQTPVVELTVASDKVDPLTVRDVAKKVADDLAFVPGVASVTKNVWQKKELMVSVKEDKLRSHDVSLSQVIAALRSQNVQLPGGDILLPNGREKTVKTDGELVDPEAVRRTVIRSNSSGYGVRVGDVADVSLGLEKPSVLYRTNGERSFSLVIIKKENADALKVVEAVKKRMDELKPKVPPGVDFRLVNKFTDYLENRISILGGNLAAGIFLILLVLKFFFPVRVAVVVAGGVVFAMMASIATIGWLGLSINLISLIGLIIVCGMLVDDAIVVVENIYRRVEGGEPVEEAILNGTAEMVAPVLASVLTTVMAFAPMLFMTGIFGKFIFQIPVMVILPLAYSVFEAFTIAPGHMLSFVGARGIQQLADEERKEHWYDRLKARYIGWIAWTLDHKKVTIGAFVAVLVVSGGVASRMKFILFPPDGIYSFFVRIDGEPGASLQEMEAFVKQVEPYIAKLPKEELQDFTAQIGLQQNDPNDPLTKRASHYAQIRVNLTPEAKRKRSVNEIVTELRDGTPKPQGAQKIVFEVAKGGPPQGRPVSLNIYGEDFAVLKKVAVRVKEELAKVTGVQDIEDSEVAGKVEVRIVPDAVKAAAVGLTVGEIAQTVRAAFAGIVATSSRTLDEEIDIRVQVKERRAESENQLGQIHIGNSRGQLIPLDRIASFEEQASRLLIQHEKFKRKMNVSAQVDLEKSTAIKANGAFRKVVPEIEKDFPDYKIEFGGEDADTKESMASLARAFAVAALTIFAILVITFKSFLQPFLVMVSIPMGFTGVVWALTIHGRPLSFMAMLGMIALAGVIVNNAIVYLDFFNTMRREGLSPQEAALKAAGVRLRPIILTSVTTILGLMPTAYGIGGYDGFVAQICLALGWGLTIGSLLTAFVFPTLVVLLEGFSAFTDRWAKRLGVEPILRVIKGR